MSLPPQIDGIPLYQLTLATNSTKFIINKLQSTAIQCSIQWWGNHTAHVLPYTYNIVIPLDKFNQYVNDIPKQQLTINLINNHNADDIVGHCTYNMKHMIQSINDYCVHGDKSIYQYNDNVELSILSSMEHKYIGSLNLSVALHDVNNIQKSKSAALSSPSPIKQLNDTIHGDHTDDISDNSLLRSPIPQQPTVQATPQRPHSLSPDTQQSSRSVVDQLLSRAMKLKNELHSAANDSPVVHQKSLQTPGNNKLVRHSKSLISPSVVSPTVSIPSDEREKIFDHLFLHQHNNTDKHKKNITAHQPSTQSDSTISPASIPTDKLITVHMFVQQINLHHPLPKSIDTINIIGELFNDTLSQFTSTVSYPHNTTTITTNLHDECIRVYSHRLIKQFKTQDCTVKLMTDDGKLIGISNIELQNFISIIEQQLQQENNVRSDSASIVLQNSSQGYSCELIDGTQQLIGTIEATIAVGCNDEINHNIITAYNAIHTIQQHTKQHLQRKHSIDHTSQHNNNTSNLKQQHSTDSDLTQQPITPHRLPSSLKSSTRSPARIQSPVQFAVDEQRKYSTVSLAPTEISFERKYGHNSNDNIDNALPDYMSIIDKHGVDEIAQLTKSNNIPINSSKTKQHARSQSTRQSLRRISLSNHPPSIHRTASVQLHHNRRSAMQSVDTKQLQSNEPSTVTTQPDSSLHNDIVALEKKLELMFERQQQLLQQHSNNISTQQNISTPQSILPAAASTTDSMPTHPASFVTQQTSIASPTQPSTPSRPRRDLDDNDITEAASFDAQSIQSQSTVTNNNSSIKPLITQQSTVPAQPHPMVDSSTSTSSLDVQSMLAEIHNLQRTLQSTIQQVSTIATTQQQLVQQQSIYKNNNTIDSIELQSPIRTNTIKHDIALSPIETIESRHTVQSNTLSSKHDVYITIENLRGANIDLNVLDNDKPVILQPSKTNNNNDTATPMTNSTTAIQQPDTPSTQPSNNIAAPSITAHQHNISPTKSSNHIPAPPTTAQSTKSTPATSITTAQPTSLTLLIDTPAQSINDSLHTPPPHNNNLPVEHKYDQSSNSSLPRHSTFSMTQQSNKQSSFSHALPPLPYRHRPQRNSIDDLKYDSSNNHTASTSDEISIEERLVRQSRRKTYNGSSNNNNASQRCERDNEADRIARIARIMKSNS